MRFLHKTFSIYEGTDKEQTIDAISKGVTLQGYNIWILICSAMLASIGLDTNSTAVIIGAMLISPLMSPILGVGLSIAIHDKELLFRSVRNLSIAVILSLATAVLFFLLTPLRDVTSEIQARTYPTLLDVLIALFGGVAGIVSASRSEKTTAIPGVAIATALMPPLCTAGYGIATAQWNYFFGAFYLFFINAVFISLATFIIAKYLKFHEKEYVDERMQKLYSRWFTVLAIIVILPSIYFLYTVYKKESTKKQLQSFVLDKIQSGGNEILKWELQPTDSATLIKVYHSGNPIRKDEVSSIDSVLRQNGLSNYRLKVFRVNLTKEEISSLTAEAARQAINEIQLQSIKETLPVVLKDSIKFYNNIAGPETKIAFPFIDTVKSGMFISISDKNTVDTLPVFFYKSKRNLSNSQKAQLYQYLLLRSNKDTVALLPF
ncbi:TIGR00341 family protein [Panacibacter ginsenosidivorans]|uniref:TIGR00341 family protein n=1 Tax=Panacibacter ginsenosidivorans TaxID=1813871 RepID=A0A5B8VFI7_9BACT|nr:TIGR00341 family protein [Panacibacter ginsenosidivorans]QEC69752.1 TIGR00341 family protein [Panacibacter ginsenosidivorans]